MAEVERNVFMRLRYRHDMSAQHVRYSGLVEDIGIFSGEVADNDV